KNSDRSPNEPNLTIFYPARETSEKELQCTYIKIPQVPKTNAHLLIQPSWMWGGEMGINEYGVIIGNEAVFTKTKNKKTERLLGMDLLRLGLERGKSAKQALSTIVFLLEVYGQGGNCGFDKPFYYDNSFLIVDDEEAYVLETSGKDWVSGKIEDFYNISNRLSLNDNYFESSKNINNFAKSNSDFLYTHFSGSKAREAAACSQLRNKVSVVEDMMRVLRGHHPKDRGKLYSKGSVRSICMHKSMLGDHTTSSMIITKTENSRFIWLNGCSTPCLSVYKPVMFSTIVAPVFVDKKESLKYWLDREYLVRAIYSGLINEGEYQEKIDSLEKIFLEKAESMKNKNKKEMVDFVTQCANKEKELIEEYRKEIDLVKKNPQSLPKIWRNLMSNLGKNVFERKLNARIK
ncbi:MAG: hypothetical protein PHX62_02485, partial [Bacilli bacterium]|nr:hypothetical protein [Bacilli bacterium]